MKHAFTLIELLVVIVIIGVLATLATIALSSARMKARDARRVSDLKQISTALELYMANENVYPSLITAGQPMVGATSGKTYMNKVPADPSTNLSYAYGAGTNFTLRATLENRAGELSAGNIVITGNSGIKTPDNQDARLVDDALNFGGSLVSHWPLDGNVGLTNLSGNYTATLVGSGIALASGRYGESNGSYSFSGVDGSMIRVGYHLAGATAATVCLWAKRSDADYLINAGLISYYTWASTPVNYNFILFEGSVKGLVTLRYGDGASTVGLNGMNAMVSDVWNHFCGVFNANGNGDGALYHNGVVKATLSSSSINNLGSLSTTGNGIGINESSGVEFKGSISDVRIYNKALSSNEIFTLYEATRP